MLFFALSIACAQNPGGSISGHILDEDGDPLPRATITLYQDSILITGALSDLNGYYKVEEVPPGRYTLAVSYVGCRTHRVEDILITSGQVHSLEVVLDTAVDLDNIQPAYFNIKLFPPNRTRDGSPAAAAHSSQEDDERDAPLTDPSEGIHQADAMPASVPDSLGVKAGKAKKI
jgi:hypothetical protein